MTHFAHNLQDSLVLPASSFILRLSP